MHVDRFRPLLAFCLIACAGCASDDGGDSDPDAPDAGSLPPSPATTRALFQLEPSPMRYGVVPFPDDAYLDDSGHVSVRDIPSAASAAYRIALAEGLEQLDGFGARSAVTLRFDGELDPGSLPADPEASLAPEASVFLVDADTNSTWAYQRVPVEVHWIADARELRVVPAYGRPLAAGRRYAVVVTTGVLANGDKIERAPQLKRILDAREVLDDPAERAARTRYEPVLAALVPRGVPRSSVAAIAVFTVQSAGTDLEDARAALHAEPLPPLVFDRIVPSEGLDALLGMLEPGVAGLDRGAPHDQIGLLAQGRVSLPSFTATRPELHGSMLRDEAGALQVQGRAEVPFSLFLPRNVSPSAPLPLLIVLHDEGGERSDAAAIANALCGRGYVVAAADAPFHGLRAGGVDTRARFTEEPVADGFGDSDGDFAGFSDTAGPLAAGHPLYHRDAVRQAAIDTMGLLHALAEADFRSFAEQSAELSSMRLQRSRVALLGIGLGAELAVLVAPLELAVDAVALAFPGGVGVDGWFEAPASQPLAEALLGRLGRSPSVVDWDLEPPSIWPDVDAFRAVGDRGSALAQAAALRRSPTNVLVLMAKGDERAPNARTEALAAALGARPATAVSTIDPDLDLVSEERLPGDTVRANVSLEAGDLTRTLVVLDPATHDALTLQRGERVFEPARSPPFEALPEPEAVSNPTAAALMQIAYFFESLRGCEPAMRSPCSATALVP